MERLIAKWGLVMLWGVGLLVILGGGLFTGLLMITPWATEYTLTDIGRKYVELLWPILEALSVAGFGVGVAGGVAWIVKKEFGLDLWKWLDDPAKKP